LAQLKLGWITTNGSGNEEMLSEFGARQVDKKRLIIPAITPYFLDKGEEWFSENYEKILSAYRRLRWWKSRLIILEEGMKIRPSDLIASLLELGYSRASQAQFSGEFSGGGAFFRVAPVGSSEILEIEFLGNRIERIGIAGKISPRKAVAIGKEFGELRGLKEGDYVVHADHGIGIFRGISENFFVIEYAPPLGGHLPDILRVPLNLAKKITPYYGFERPKVHRLGSQVWFATRKKVREEVLNIAKELLELYSRRHAATRPPFKEYPEMEQALEESFPYSETPDQRRAMEEISRDLSSNRPMDRLLCGDVGFGKTEVALRTAWRVVLNGMQVALLAPTTVLGDQHFRVFKERLEPLGCRVVMLSRLIPKKEETAILNLIREGKADVVIGTHRILSPDVSFRRLGLLIIDEEQRFGVLAKEKLKKIRPTLDTLSLSATPIPRTLSMVIAKIRPVSFLRTPPPGRIGVKTFVLPFSQRIVREAILKELERNGQVYFLHNRIETMHERVEELTKLLPRRQVAFVHGRMEERHLIKTMSDFRSGKIDVLVTTTIVENGLDLSNVNTLIVADATRLGLGQAHQLRGRVGRGTIQAYAYFLYSPRNLSALARERLKILQESEALGSGFDIAMKDLELRGAGNILGREQSGAVNAVGLNLYLEMLSEAVVKLQNLTPFNS
jgi:transcription-repair coupling factor (superfamily II helicase)